MKSIISHVEAGSRLYPLTLIAMKQSQPGYNRPLIFRPLAEQSLRVKARAGSAS